MAKESLEYEDSDVFYLDPSEIKVREGLERFRKEMGEVDDLAESIKQHGQLQPIVITEDNELIVGGRRLAACLLNDLFVLCIRRENVNDLTLRILELEENIKRKDFTAGEQVLATRELHTLKQEQHGKSTAGRLGGHTIKDTADILNKTHVSVLKDIELADLIDEFPELKNAKKKSEIRSAGQALRNVIKRSQGIAEFEGVVTERSDVIKLKHQDAREFMSSLKEDTVDLLITDPPYGINIDKIAISAGGETGKRSTSGFKYDDETKSALALYGALAKESARFCKESAHAFIFVGPEHFWPVSVAFTATGWLVNPKPLIWIKGNAGQNNQPDYWPSSCYEMILMARKKDARLLKQGLPDWFQFDPVKGKKHDAEKPEAVVRELIQRTTLPSLVLCDPFAGSGAFLSAGLREQLMCIGSEILEDAYNVAMEKISKTLEELEDAKSKSPETEG